MATYRFDLNEEYSELLEQQAKDHHMNIQEYIRYKLFNVVTIFSVDELIKRIINGNFENKEFTVPDAYTEEEWAGIDRGNAGVLGKNFYNYITEKRMAKAKELLVLKGYCPREIATEIGYDNEYSFKRAFQRTYGITPRDFLEKEGKNAR